jgi:hypothetical protein
MENQWPSSFKDVTYATIEDLPAQHRAIFVAALKNVLSTELAEVTYAQILDGAPVVDVATDRRVSRIDYRHPVRQHKTLCSGVIERIRSFRDSLDATIIPFGSVVCIHL